MSLLETLPETLRELKAAALSRARAGNQPSSWIQTATKTELAEYVETGSRAAPAAAGPAEQPELAALVSALLRHQAKAAVDAELGERGELRPRVVLDFGSGKPSRDLPSVHHAALRDMLELVRRGFANIMLVGPAGSGKTTLARQLAETLGRPYEFLSLSAGVPESALLGKIRPAADGWHYQPSPFVRGYTSGAVILLDEIDAADSNMLTIVNAALGNCAFSVPDSGQEAFQRHTDTVIVLAGNTYGRGADRIYVGRNELDGATLDRAAGATLEVGYDRDLERSLVGQLVDSETADAILADAERIRARIGANLRRIWGTRSVLAMARHCAAGDTIERARERCVIGWTRDELAKLGS